MTTPLANSVNARRRDALATLETRRQGVAALIARDIARMGWSGAKAEAKRNDGETLRFVVSAAVEDSFGDTNADEERLKVEGWRVDGPAVCCQSTGIKVRVYRRDV